MAGIREKYSTLLNSISFAARAHDGQKRKDRQTPYVAHVFRVSMIVRHVFGFEDPQAMIAAVLHDTLEDTTVDYDDLEGLLGEEAQPIADWVATLSKDNRAPESEREANYLVALEKAPWPVKICKLADIFDNLTDCGHLPIRHKKRTHGRSVDYLQVLEKSGLEADDPLETIHQKALTLVRGLLDELQADIDEQ